MPIFAVRAWIFALRSVALATATRVVDDIAENYTLPKTTQNGVISPESAILSLMTDDQPDSPEYVTCPNCGERVPVRKMNLCFIARYDCPQCGSELLIEGDQVRAEKPPTQP